MPPLAVPPLVSRSFVAVLALLLLPLTALLSAAPAHATANFAQGSAYDALGDPLDGVTVDALAAPTFTAVVSTTTTGVDGDYALGLAEGGSYRLRFSKTAYVTSLYGGEAQVDVDDAGAISVDGEPVADNALDDVTLASTPFALTGAVETAGGVGIVGITVRAFPEGSTEPEEVIDTADSGAAGSYTLDLPIGSYDLEFADNDGSAPTYTTTSLAQVRVAQEGSLSVAGSPVDGLPEVAMAVSSADTPHPVTGSVVDVNGADVDGLTVSAVPQGATPGANAASDITGADGVLGDHGRYRLMLKPGSYQLEVEGGADWADTTYVGEGTGTATVQVQLNGTVLVNGTEAFGGELGSTQAVGSTAYALSGSVTEGATGLSGITVIAYPEGDTDPASAVDTDTSGAAGAYALNLPVGSYVVRFSDNDGTAPHYVQTWLGGPPTGAPVTVGQGGVLSYAGSTITSLPDVAMSEPLPDATYDVTGAVLDALGEPISGVAVHGVHTGTTPADQDVDTTTDGDGAYLLQLEAGTYTIAFDATADFAGATYNGDGETAAAIEVTDQGVVRVNGTEAVGGVLDPVSLIGTTGYPVTGEATNGSTGLPGLTVGVYTEGSTAPEDELVTTTTGALGAYSLELPVGSYSLRYSGSSGGTLYSLRWFGAGSGTGTPVQVGQNGVISVDGETVATLPDVVMTVADTDTQHPLPGDVVDNNYDALPGVLVTAVAAGGGAVTDTATSDSDGHFELGLVPGSYQVKYDKSGYPTTWYPDPESEGTATVVVALDGAMRIGETPLTEGLDTQVLVSSVTHPIDGTVVDEALAGLSGITVQAIIDGTSTVAATTTSGSGGAYTLQVPVGTYGIRFTDNVVAAPTYAVTSFGGPTATPVKVATGGQVSVENVTVASLPPVTMAAVGEDTRYDLTGSVYDERYDNVLEGATVKVVPVAGTPAGNAETTTTQLENTDGGAVINYRVAVLPGKYQLEFSKTGYQTAWLESWENPGIAVTVTVAPNGSITAPGLELVDGVLDSVQLLLPAPAMLTAPKLTGTLAYGQVLTTTFGTWSPFYGKENAYIEWFLDGKPADNFAVGTYWEKFKVPAGAVGKKLSYRIVIEDPEGVRASARFTSAPTAAIRKATSSVTAAYKAGKLTATVKVPGVPRPTGKITVFDGKRKVGAGTLVAKSKGVIVIAIAKLTKGRHTLTVKYAGTATIAASKKVVRIRV